MRIAICGGTFDPFHRGHLEPVLAVRESMGWDRVLYVPAYRQPFKLDRETASGYDRYAMVQLATMDHDALGASPLELQRGETSFTVDTLEELHRRHPDAAFDWIIGDDNLADLEKWRDLPRIFELARFAVLTRGGAQVPAGVRGPVVFARNETVPVSSTEIRRRVRGGEPIDAFVDALVSRYIHHNRLYREANT
jgi:nicotinate-nucleotide adenylyltransferase